MGNSRLLEALTALEREPVSAETIVLTGITGGSVAGRAIAIDRLRLGDFDLRTGGMAIADLPIFELWDLAETPALFIGMDFLKRFSKVSIDYGRKEYRLELASLNLASRS